MGCLENFSVCSFDDRSCQGEFLLMVGSVPFAYIPEAAESKNAVSDIFSRME